MGLRKANLVIGLAEVSHDHQRAAKTLVRGRELLFEVPSRTVLKGWEVDKKRKGLLYHPESIP